MIDTVSFVGGTGDNIATGFPRLVMVTGSWSSFNCLIMRRHVALNFVAAIVFISIHLDQDSYITSAHSIRYWLNRLFHTFLLSHRLQVPVDDAAGEALHPGITFGFWFSKVLLRASISREPLVKSVSLERVPVLQSARARSLSATGGGLAPSRRVEKSALHHLAAGHVTFPLQLAVVIDLGIEFIVLFAPRHIQ